MITVHAADESRVTISLFRNAVWVRSLPRPPRCSVPVCARESVCGFEICVFQQQCGFESCSGMLVNVAGLKEPPGARGNGADAALSRKPAALEAHADDHARRHACA